MSEFKYYKASEHYRTLFYQFPRVLMHSKKYNKLSDGAKLAYMVFQDRLKYSIKNNWVDEDNNVYFIFTNDEICKLLNKSKPTVIKLKKELEKYGLLKQINMGFDRQNNKQRPNRLYLADLEVEATDVYVYQSLEKVGTSEGKESLLSKNQKRSLKNMPKVGISEGKESLLSEIYEGKESLLNQYKELSTKDTKDIKDISTSDKTHLELISNSINKKDTEVEKKLIDTYIKENNIEQLYGEKLIREIIKMSRSNFDTFAAYMNKLEFAQKSVEKEEDISIPTYDNNPYAEYTNDQLLSAFNRCMYQFRFGKVNNIESYLFISFKTVFKDLALALKESI